MNPGIDDRDVFDREMRKLHAAAVDHISPLTLARLRAARHAAHTAPQRGHGWRWMAASAFSAVLAVVVGVRFLPQSAPVPHAQTTVATTVPGDDYSYSMASLEENPDLYLWLASSEADPLAME